MPRPFLLLFGRGKTNGPDVLMESGVYDSDFLAIHEDRGKRVKAINALIHSFDLTVVNDRRFPDRISSIDQYLSLRCYFGISRGSFLFIQGC
jgi:hypothetical protein